MTSPIEQAGAVKESSEYATLSMDRAITGLYTQRSPLRDADVPYLYSKFYSASRFDSLIDGINREMTSRLSLARAPGSSIYNSNTFPGINSFYSYKRIVSGAEVIRVIADGKDGNIYDATAGQKTTIFTKSGGAGKARFQGVNTTLYFTDGVENKKWMQPAPWAAQTSMTTTTYAVGTTVIDSNGKIEYLINFKAGNITNVALAANVATLTFNNTNFTLQQGMSFAPSGLSGASFLNGKLLIATAVIPSGSTFLVTVAFVHAPYASASDSGDATTTDVGTPATTGSGTPSWPGAGGTVVDGLSVWKNFGVPVFDWGPPAAPSQPPTLGFLAGPVFWLPNKNYGSQFIVDRNGNIQQGVSSIVGGVDGSTGAVLPLFSQIPNLGISLTGFLPIKDGGVTWYACGTVRNLWQASQVLVGGGAIGGYVIVDTNGNIQQATNNGTTGATEPTWNTAPNGTTNDNGVIWRNSGPCLALAFQGWKYGYAYHCIDGSVSSLSPLTVRTNGILNGVFLGGVGSGAPTCDSIWIFRTADNGSTPLFIASIANPGANTLWSFSDQNSDPLLIPELPGPQASSNNPPPIGMTAPVYHLQRIWAIYQNTVVYSGGPNVLVGNGNTAFAPLSFSPFPEQPIKLVPITVNNGGILVICTSNTYIILGTGTASNPFYATMYMRNVGILNYDAVDVVGSTLYMFTGKGKAVSLDPGAGYVEYGFPIGDQFKSVTTGKGAKTLTGAPVGALYSPASTYVTWAELSSGDTAVYVCDGAVGWFRYSPTASPESGFVWSPRRVIVGGTSAVQAIETTPGISQLLIAPASSGPILFRDSSVHTDNGTAYQSYDVKGNIVLCQSGEVAEIAHIAVKSIAVGTRPKVGLLLGEITPTSTTPFDWLEITSADPPDLPPSTTIYSDRYSALQNGVCPKCDNFQLAVDYGTQNAADEMLMFSVYGAKYAERRQQ
jgi:hypothetical protein